MHQPHRTAKIQFLAQVIRPDPDDITGELVESEVVDASLLVVLPPGANWCLSKIWLPEHTTADEPF